MNAPEGSLAPGASGITVVHRHPRCTLTLRVRADDHVGVVRLPADTSPRPAVVETSMEAWRAGVLRVGRRGPFASRRIAGRRLRLAVGERL